MGRIGPRSTKSSAPRSLSRRDDNHAGATHARFLRDVLSRFALLDDEESIEESKISSLKPLLDDPVK